MGKISTGTLWIGIAAIASLLAFAAFAGMTARNGEARPALPRYGNVFQSGALVGWATGARMISSLDGAVVEFDQISHARQLVQDDEFEYGGLKMRIAQVDYAKGEKSATDRTARPDKALLRVTAKIQRAR